VGRIAAFREGSHMAKKKPADENKRKGRLVRVSEQFAEALDDAVGLEKTNVAAFADAYLLPIVQKRYKDVILQKARRIGAE
jgi:hypothetical protein